MIEGLTLIVLSVLTGAVLSVGYSLHKWVKRCHREIETIGAELDRIRGQLGTPQNAVFRLVAAQDVPEASQTPGKVSDRPNPA